MKCKTLLSLVFFMTCSVSANNVIRYGDFTLYMDKKERSIIHVVSEHGVSDVSCKINNWKDEYGWGSSSISITNDEKGVLIYQTNQYLSTDELMQCNAQGIALHTIPQSDEWRYTIVDINFNKRLALLVVLEDVRYSTYTAIVSSFDSNKNLLSGPGFLSEKKVDIPFSTGGVWYGGKISLDGRYAYPYYIDCAVDSFPGVWDIKKNKKVVFDASLSDDDVEDKCQKLFDGQATLEELGGKLVRPKK